MDINQKLPNSNEVQLVSQKTSTIAKTVNTEADIKNNNQSPNLKQHKNSLELERNGQKPTENGNNIPNQTNMENNNINISDSPSGAARLKITPLKGLSSSLRPRLFKSIGIQVGSEKW